MKDLRESTLELMRAEVRKLMRNVARIDLGTTYRILKDLVAIDEDSLVATAISSLVEAREIRFETRRLGGRRNWVGITRAET